MRWGSFQIIKFLLNNDLASLRRPRPSLRAKRPQVPLTLSKDLENFLSVEHGTKLTKAQVMKTISSYIKEKNLQVAENKRQFIPNKELSKIFKIKKAHSMTFVEINKHVSHHLSK